MTNYHEAIRIVSAWGLTLIGIAIQIIPLLQVISLLLAITVSVIAIIKHYKK